MVGTAVTNDTGEIHGFTSAGEYARFIEHVEARVSAGLVEEIDADEAYGRGEIYGGRWFRDLATGVIWRLVPPDLPFRGLWEPVVR
jgi:hypothetical protein